MYNYGNAIAISEGENQIQLNDWFFILITWKIFLKQKKRTYVVEDIFLEAH